MLKTYLKKTCITGYIAVLCMAAPAHAALPLATDDADTTGLMKFQVETSVEFGWDRENEHGITTKSNYQTLNTALTAGVLDSLDLVVAYPFTWQKIEENSGNKIDNSGFNDFSMALKWRFLELGPASFAIKPSITFPTGNRDRRLGAGRAAYGATLISSVEFKPVTIHANIGYSNQQYTDIDKDGSRENLWNLSLAGTVEVLKGLQLVAEIGAATNPHKGNATWPAFITGGVIYSANDTMDLSMGVKGGLTSPETDIALLTGLTFKFP
jgi:Putative MetA-pathway of phenol degradation